MIVFRITRAKYKDDLSGDGAAKNGARWNNKGEKMLYTASSRSLAMAEVAVHVPFGILPIDYFIVSIELPKIEPIVISEEYLEGSDWKSHPPSPFTQIVGDGFLKENSSLVMAVPSVVAAGEFNYLINPNHKDFHKVKVIDIQPFKFDPRLFGSDRN
ncbi:RES family NAD+ phosphorylase [Pricia sp.]|uniref:RES family NAD+ phosphorylase n=1 Tax=Pricia sp. TaxID=2268138 RepID=UPI003594859E